MSWRSPSFVLLVLAAAACVDGGPADTAGADAGPNEAPDAGPTSACPAPATGELPLTTVEADPGYDAALAALDLDALPATIELAALSPTERRLVLYMLDEPDDEAVVSIDRNDASARGPLGVAVLGAFARGDGALDFSFLRRGLHRFYACARAAPPTLDEFLSGVHDFRTDPGETVDSAVKDLRRRIFRSASAGVFVAQTLRADDSVRETEIILSDRRADSALDFLEYDATGALRAASEFATGNGADVVGSVPFSCIACHGTRNVTPPAP